MVLNIRLSAGAHRVTIARKMLEDLLSVEASRLDKDSVGHLPGHDGAGQIDSLDVGLQGFGIMF